MKLLKPIEPEKGEIRYDKENDVLYISFNDIEKGKWISLVIENLKEKSTYFIEDDILWIKIVDERSYESEYFSDDFVVDFDENGDPVGVEIFGWKRFHAPDYI
ncbi:DUF2283 domain-containing protein [Desulfurobacterium sp.]